LLKLFQKVGRKIIRGISNGSKSLILGVVGDKSASGRTEILRPSESSLLLGISKSAGEGGNISHYAGDVGKNIFIFFAPIPKRGTANTAKSLWV
jgi:hypothetical protein